MEIFKKMALIGSEIGAISKDKKNQSQGFLYRGIDQFYNAINPLLAKNNVFCCPTVLSRDCREVTNTKGTRLMYTTVEVEYKFYAEDGSHVACSVFGEGMDSGDKSTTKAMAIAHKYALMQIFCVPTEETHKLDPDADFNEIAYLPPTLPQINFTLFPHLNVIKNAKNMEELKENYTNAVKLINKSGIPPGVNEDFISILAQAKDEKKSELSSMASVPEQSELDKELEGLADLTTVSELEKACDELRGKWASVRGSFSKIEKAFREYKEFIEGMEKDDK